MNGHAVGPLDLLSARQRDLVATWFPGARVVADLSWGLVPQRVLELETIDGERVVVKAGGPVASHVEREIRGHLEWTGPWLESGHVGRLLRHDAEAWLVAIEHLPGVLVEGSPAQGDPEVFRQAGALLRRFHDQTSVLDESWNGRFVERVERFLDLPHRIDAAVEEAVRVEVATWPRDGGTVLVPTHGDWQPRNWLVDDGTVRVIDLGRADLRPVTEDFARLARQDFGRDPGLEVAFLDGYGCDPREPAQWRRTLVGEAVGTAVWAYGVGDHEFEAVGHRQLAALYPG